MTDKESVLCEFEENFIHFENAEEGRKYLRILEKNYDRPYHNFKHINNGLNIINKFYDNQISKCLIYDSKHLWEFRFAWIFHDIIVGCRNAEMLSAVIAAKAVMDLKFDMNEDIICDLIQETSIKNALYEGPSKTGMIESDLIHDLDFMNIGIDYKSFEMDDNNIEKEYGSRFDRIKRVKFLLLLTKMNHLYRTKLFRKDYEHKAIINLNKIIREKYLLEFKQLDGGLDFIKWLKDQDLE